ncbi:phenylacetate-CoA ligase [Natronocella acetinitrilica]|uniref:Phenylacetate-CoA ligase n=1 Tax=Natronocella acetinitrilica TaxID=414046 RepID=A0AAE3G9T7_9GAMM|nr:hypothetical protein [Natronocella acetinitrilica]MCP1677158.1 phenylacetate-CoA ligase [Natronocella acetinitrilica]
MTFYHWLYDIAAQAQRTPFRAELAAALQRQYWDRDQLICWQLDKLNRLLDHARRTTSNYASLPASPLTSLADLPSLPLLSKDVLRTKAASLTSPFAARAAVRKTTGGSTGAPVTLRKSRDGIAVELATAWRGMSWVGVHPGDRQARFWGVPHSTFGRLRAKVTDSLTNRVRCSAFAFTDADLGAYYRALKKTRPTYCYGYPSMLREFSSFIERNGLAPISSVRAVVTTAEPLRDRDRSVIERVLHAKVANEYGCGEVGTIAHECEHGELHINADALIVELLSSNGVPASPGEQGQIVVTDLNNFATPLIRYELQDYGMLSDHVCGCGRTLPVLRNVTGREYDMLLGRDGRKFHGEFFLYLFEDMKKSGLSVDAFRLTQMSMEDFDLELVVKSEADARHVYHRFVDELKQKIGNDVNVTLFRRHIIERERSGKLRVIRREKGFGEED